MVQIYFPRSLFLPFKISAVRCVLDRDLPPKDVGQRCVRSPEGDHVEEEVEILGSPGFWECELNGLGASDDEIFRCGAERNSSR